MTLVLPNAFSTLRMMTFAIAASLYSPGTGPFRVIP
jgi:hypothetical protein